MKLVIDSSVFVSSLDPTDRFHSECSPLFKRLVDLEVQARCPVLVLAEVVCVIHRRTRDAEFARAAYQSLSLLPSINWLGVSLQAVEWACELGIRTGLRGADAIVLQVAEEYGMPLVTKDEEIKRRAPKGIPVFEPSEVTG